jgi:hypothetical protein
VELEEWLQKFDFIEFRKKLPLAAVSKSSKFRVG